MMNGTNAAVAVDPAPKLKAWIWFADMEIPDDGEWACYAHLHGKKDLWLLHGTLDSVSHDEGRGEVWWDGPILVPGDTLRLRIDEKEVGIVRVLEGG